MFVMSRRILVAALMMVASAAGLNAQQPAPAEWNEAVCEENLRDIAQAVYYWYQSRHVTRGAEIPPWDDLVGPDKFLRQKPECPGGGEYTITGDGDVVCSLANLAEHPHLSPWQGNVLPMENIRQQKCICQKNLRAIDRAKVAWYIQSGRADHDVAEPTWDDLVGFTDGPLASIPECPSGGVYTIGTVDQITSCTLAADPNWEHVFTLKYCIDAERLFPFSEGFNSLWYLDQQRRMICQENQGAIFRAIERWGADTAQAPGAMPTWDDIAGPGKYLPIAMTCPEGGTYSLGVYKQEAVSCSLAAKDPAPHDFTFSVDYFVLEGIGFHYSQKMHECADNLCRIAAWKQLAIDGGADPHTETTPDMLLNAAGYAGTLRDIVFPQCPLGGTYTLGPLDSTPHCSRETDPDFPHVIKADCGEAK